MSIGVTVSTVESEKPFQVAVIVVVPAAKEVTSPLGPAVLLIVATDVSEELQVARAVSSCVVLSENFAVAVNWCVAPKAMLGFTGVTAIDVIVTTLRVVKPEMLPEEAEIIVVPVVTAVANPVLSIVATVAVSDFQVTDFVMF